MYKKNKKHVRVNWCLSYLCLTLKKINQCSLPITEIDRATRFIPTEAEQAVTKTHHIKKVLSKVGIQKNFISLINGLQENSFTA